MSAKFVGLMTGAILLAAVGVANAKVELTRFRGAHQALNGGFSDAQDAPALFT